jgi:hypothetical protein
MTTPRLAFACAGLLAAACTLCPPSWLEHPPISPDWIYASGSSGEVFVEAEAHDVAATRAARRIAEALGLDVEARLSVVERDGRLFAEAIGPSGPLDVFDGLELVSEVECEGVTHVLVRLRRPTAR